MQLESKLEPGLVEPGLVEPSVVRMAHSGAEARVGRAVARREAREAELDALLAPGATRPVG
ncbi:MAG TPA: hypothetical protein VL119_13650, partial [Acidimicrobiia bacterium]|nr:hypothetical protein [Acidimicrobiia bacterium]